MYVLVILTGGDVLFFNLLLLLTLVISHTLCCRLSRFEKTNEMLINFNILSADRFAVTSRQYRQHTQLMYDMKRDLDCIFKRIRLVFNKKLGLYEILMLEENLVEPFVVGFVKQSEYV